MKILESTIQTFNNDEYKHLYQFIESKPSKRKRKDLLLLNLLRKNISPTDDTIKAELDLNARSNAYHALRKRLLKLVMHFTYVKRVETDNTASAEVMHLISFSDFQHENNQKEYARKTLDKAKKLAEEHRLLGLLDLIFEKQLTQHSFSLEELELFSQKKEEIKLAKDEQDRASMAFIYLKSQILDARRNNRMLPFQLMVDHTLRKYNLDSAIIQRPQMLYQVIETVRENMASKKDFLEFEKFLNDITTQHYSIINVNKEDLIFKIKINYIKVHTAYRNRRFGLAFRLSKKFEKEINNEGAQFKKLFEAQHTLLHAAILFYSGEIDQSISLLTEAKKHHDLTYSPKQLNYLILNLSFYQYANKDIDSAIKTAQELQHTTVWYKKNMGAEWAMKKAIMESIIQIDLENQEIGLSKINTLMSSFKDLLKDDLYKRVEVFLKIIKKILSSPNYLISDELNNLISEKLTIVDSEKEDLQAMSFYVWLKALQLKKPYYHLLLETTTRSDFDNY
ncbi:hypothetical protein OAH12_00845 [Cyclobacteriaceae bacterium]|nr:hypothetical protein [Cyclobacteriaceae bacterium]